MRSIERDERGNRAYPISSVYRESLGGKKMRVINMFAEVDPEKCTACRTCERVCPTLSIKVGHGKGAKKAVVDLSTCVGCGACSERCEFGAVSLKDLAIQRVIGVDPNLVDRRMITDLCLKARLHPEQVLCFCTGTRAEEVAAAIIQGASSPEEVSREVGARTGCKVECFQPILRLLVAAGKDPKPVEGGWQWYGLTPTIWDIPESVVAKYSSRGFYFEEDRALFKKLLETKTEGGDSGVL
jgi:NAD-dependent dihydropyrimidine dehydrogenase PreA subunit/bacterioferritin-associated ferredoxin